MATCAVKIGGMLFTVDYSGQKELFNELNQLQEVFLDSLMLITLLGF